MIITFGQPLPKGADAADFLASGWTKDQVIAWAKSRARFYEPPIPVAEELPPIDETPPFEAYDIEPVVKEWNYFKILGHLDGTYFYLPNGTAQIVQISANAHTKNALMALAPLEYWEVSFPSKRSVDWLSAKNALMRECCRKGIYTPENK